MPRWQRSPVATWRIAGGTLAVAAPGHRAVLFSVPAGATWEALAHPREISELAELLRAPEDDIARFLRELAQHGATEVVT